MPRTTHRTPPPDLGTDSRYARVWTAAAVVVAAVWVVVALLQTPRLPLLAIALGVGAIGGVLFVKEPVTTATGGKLYARGAFYVTALVMVVVGVGHHLDAGLTTFACLAGSSPWLIRWIADGRWSR